MVGEEEEEVAVGLFLILLMELSLEILSWESTKETLILQVPVSESLFKPPPRVWSSSTTAATLAGSQVAGGR